MGHPTRLRPWGHPLPPRLAAWADQHDLDSPFPRLESLDSDDNRETPYERSRGRNALAYYASVSQDGDGSHGTSGSSGGENGTGTAEATPGGERQNGVGIAPTSKVERALGLKMLKRSQSRKMVSMNVGGSITGGPSLTSWYNAVDTSSPRLGYTVPPVSRPRRPLTSAEIMRQQMQMTVVRRTAARTRPA